MLVKMKCALLYIISTLPFLSTTSSNGDGCWLDNQELCLPDTSGYKHCVLNLSWNKELWKWNEKYTSTVHKCSGSKSMCRCTRTWYPFQDRCKCVAPTVATPKRETDGSCDYLRDVCFHDYTGYTQCRAVKKWDEKRKVEVEVYEESLVTCTGTAYCAYPGDVYGDIWLRFDEFLRTERTCFPLTPTPPFPATGVIRWNGTEDRWYSSEEMSEITEISGEISIDSKGNYMHKWLRDGKPLHFEIIIPNGTHYNKYAGNADSKDCRAFTVDYPGQLSDIWKRQYEYKLVESQRDRRNRNITNQIWNSNQKDDRVRLETVKGGWYMEYNEVKRYAIPVRYFAKTTDDDWNSNHINFNYVYRPVKGDGYFKFEDYCNNLVPRHACDYKK